MDLELFWMEFGATNIQPLTKLAPEGLAKRLRMDHTFLADRFITMDSDAF